MLEKLSMLDPKLLRTRLDEVAEQLSRRAQKIDKDWFSSREQQRRQLQTTTEGPAKSA